MILSSGNIKRIVIFSSAVSVGIFRINSEYTEEEWNDEAIDDVKAKGKESNGLMKYMASKTLAERGAISLPSAPVPCAYAGYIAAAWELYNKHKPSLPWDLAAINPPYVSFLIPSLCPEGMLNT